ncbi:MAG: hypothetical protein J6B68_08910 [Lachnospiraceae bacterium]|nr:hypothetical protein [Lachnospiraceae bacterium]
MTATSEKDLLQLKKRLLELADKSYNRGIYTYTPFLSLSEQQVFYEVQKEVAHAGYAMEGGAPICERKMIRFGSVDNLGYEEDFPIVCVEIMPVTPKFADKFTHRDFLGAVMNLGIERSTIGDIFLQKQGAILFCQESIAPYIIKNLQQVKHTNMKCHVIEAAEGLQETEPQEMAVTVASERIDGVIAKIYNISRSQSLELFRSGRIFVNGIVMENNSYQLKKEDAVTVRGYGKFVFYGVAGETRKGKERVLIGMFV